MSGIDAESVRSDPLLVTLRLRKAMPEDIGAITELMRNSLAGLGPAFYDPGQVASAVHHIGIVDRQLIDDGSYFVVEDSSGLVGCGGWSRRGRLFTGGSAGHDDDRLLDPAVDAAHIRAMFVHPSMARRGIGRMILAASEHEAATCGFQRTDLMATLPGEPMYAACGYAVLERVDLPMPDGNVLGGARMEKRL